MYKPTVPAYWTLNTTLCCDYECPTKLGSYLKNRKRLVSVVSRNSETASFSVLVEPKLITLDAIWFTLFRCDFSFSFFDVLIFVLAHFGLLQFHLVLVQGPNQKFKVSQNKPKHDRSAWCFVLFQSVLRIRIRNDSYHFSESGSVLRVSRIRIRKQL
jgi:hypothetical protein